MRTGTNSTMHEFIFARVMSEEKIRIAEAARQRGVTLSDFIRQAVTDSVTQPV